MMHLSVPREFKVYLLNPVQALFPEYRLFEFLFSPSRCAVVKVVSRFGAECRSTCLCTRVLSGISVLHVAFFFRVYSPVSCYFIQFVL